MSSEEKRITTWEHGPIDPELAARAATRVILLPESAEESANGAVYVDSTQTVGKLLACGSVPVESATPITSSTLLTENRSAVWVGPCLLISSLLLTQNPGAVALALNLIGGYITDLYPLRRQTPSVSLSIVYTSDDGTRSRKLKYNGPASGLSSLASILTELAAEEVQHGGRDSHASGADS